MIIKPGQVLEVVLGSSPADELRIVADWTRYSSTTEILSPEHFSGRTDSTTPVEICNPEGGYFARINHLNFHNYSVSTVAVTVRIRYGAGVYATLFVGSLDQNETALYTKGVGWQVKATDGTTEAVGGSGAVEGVDVLSTGEAGGVKYLREDGDGTCSWQTPSGSGDMTQAVYDPTAVSADAFSMGNMVETAGAKVLTSAERTTIGNQSGTNTGDQTSIVGITGTKTQFDTACTDGDFKYVGDAPTAHGHTVSEISDLDNDAATLSLPANTTISTFGASLVDDADASAAQATLGLVIGTNVQAWDTDLDTWATKTAPSGDVLGTTDTQTVSGKDLTAETNKLRYSKAITVESPADGDRIPIWMNERAITILGVSFASEGGTSVLFNIEYNTTIASGTVIHTDTCATSTPEWDVTPSGTTSIATDQIICLEITTVTGTVNWLTITIEYDET